MLRRRSDREKMRRRVGLHEFTLTCPYDTVAYDPDQATAWMMAQARKLHVPPGWTPQVELLQFDLRRRPVVRFSVAPRRDSSLALAQLLGSTTPERTPR